MAVGAEWRDHQRVNIGAKDKCLDDEKIQTEAKIQE